MVNVRYIAPRVPFVDENGMITREWFLFLQSFFPAQSNSVADDMVLAPAAGDSPSLRDEVAELRKAIDDVRKGALVL